MIYIDGTIFDIFFSECPYTCFESILYKFHEIPIYRESEIYLITLTYSISNILGILYQGVFLSFTKIFYRFLYSFCEEGIEVFIVSIFLNCRFFDICEIELIYHRCSIYSIIISVWRMNTGDDFYYFIVIQIL